MKGIIPESVLTAAKGLINLYGNSFEYLGKYMGTDVYRFKFPANTQTGYPFVFIYNTKDGCTDAITGFDALDIIEEVVKK